MRPVVLRSMYSQVHTILHETSCELLNDKFKLPGSQEKALRESGSLLDILTNKVWLLGQAELYKRLDWHSDLQKLLPTFVALHQKGLFADHWKLFANCKRIHPQL